MTAAPPLPYRRISRISNEMHLAATILIDRALPQDYDRAIVLLVIMRVCAPDWTAHGTLRRPARPVRFTSSNAVATSLQRSPETIRRHVGALVAAGLCVRGPAGVAVNPDPAVEPDLLRLYADGHDLLLGFIEDLAALGLLPAPVRTADDTLLAAIVNTTLDIMLVPFEGFGPLMVEWSSMRVWCCVGALNVRHVMADPVLTRRYAFDSTPDAVRRPIPLRTVARTLNLPYATVWRHARLLEARGLIAQTDRGWLVRTAQLRDDAVESRVVETTLYYLRRMSALVAAGLNPARVADRYIHGRPPLAPER